jgi:hypothetical protein
MAYGWLRQLVGPKPFASLLLYGTFRVVDQATSRVDRYYIPRLLATCGVERS